MATSTTLTVNYSQVVEMFKEMGFKMAENWDVKRLTKKLGDLPALMADEVDVQEEPESEEARQLLAEICQAVEDDADIDIKGYPENGKAAPKEAAKTAKKETAAKEPKEKKSLKEKKEPKEKKEKIGTDKYGSRLNSKNAALNKALSNKPKAMAQLVSDAGLEGTYYNHFNKMVEKGFAEKTEDGYKLKK